jgi:hypothetical protein
MTGIDVHENDHSGALVAPISKFCGFCQMRAQGGFAAGSGQALGQRVAVSV